MKNNFRGKRAELGVYDDASNFTDEEKATLKDMLSRESLDVGCNILDDRLWIEGDNCHEFIVPHSELFYNKPFKHIDKDTADKLYEIAKLNPIDILEGNFTFKVNNTELMEEQQNA